LQVNNLKSKLGILGLATITIFTMSQNSQTLAAAGKVSTGLDILEFSNYGILKNKRVGLITNHTALDNKGRHILNVFAKQDQFKLKAIFTPEHGLRGSEDKEFIPSEVYGENIPVYSLYGNVRKPTNQMLDGLDVLVYDIQDIGTRYYTYTTTMAYCMEAAASRGIPFVVLDRPDPINGNTIEGEVLNEKFRSFTGYFTIPTRYAMTIGELANYYKGEYKINANLKVIKMENWQRGMWFDQTGLKWVNPSPNIRSLNSAILYPGMGMLETVNISVGRGTSSPFSYYGAPWIDNFAVLEEFEQNRTSFPGLKFNAVNFTPNASTYANQRLSGFKIDITDRNKVRSFDAMVYTLEALKKLHPNNIEYEGMKRSFGSSILTSMMDGKYTASQVLGIVTENQDKFMPIREKYLLY